MRSALVRVVCLLTFLLLFGSQAAKAQRTWYANVGAETKDEAGQANAFLPNEIWINAGDSIQWSWQPKNEPHTVTFLIGGQTRPTPPPPIGPSVGPPFIFANECPAPNPYNGGTATYNGSMCVSSAALNGGTAPSTFTVTFPSAGNYKLVCLIHANMNGTVHVLGQAAPLPYMQSDYDEQAKNQTHDILKDADSPPQEVNDFPPSQNEVLMIGEMKATGGGRQYLAIVRFFPDTINIQKGETVEFTNVDPTEPHTVTSGASDTLTNDMARINVSGTADGALAGTVNSAADFENAAPPATGLNSGFLQAAPEDAAGRAQSPSGITRIRIQFNVAGTFFYHCALHDKEGMQGVVVVK
jgi:plastocyanin